MERQSMDNHVLAITAGSKTQRATSVWQRSLQWVFHLYYDGFRNMTIGKTLWAVIIIKLIIIFGILKLFFFPNYLSEHSDKGGEADFVATELIDRAALPQ